MFRHRKTTAPWVLEQHVVLEVVTCRSLGRYLTLCSLDKFGKQGNAKHIFTINYTNFYISQIVFLLEYNQHFSAWNSPLVERIRKRRAFADPELNQVSDATLLNAAVVSHISQPAQTMLYEYEALQNSYIMSYATSASSSISLINPSFVTAYTTAPATQQPSQQQQMSTENLQTPTSKKPKLSFSIEAIMGLH